MTRAWRLEAFGLAHLKLASEPLAPVVRRREVRVRIRACTLNYRDLLIARGHYDPKLVFPTVPLSDGAGEVVEVGADVDRFVVGDRVIGVFAPRWIGGRPSQTMLRYARGTTAPGMLRTELVDDEMAFVKTPKHLSDVEGAALACAGVTAWSALAGVRAGETVLTQGTGGVSIFALQLAQILGARVFITSSSAAKRERAKALGAALALDYRDNPAWGKTIASLGGVDRVVELGGATLDQSLRAVQAGGEIALIGILGGAKAEVALTRILMNAVKVRGVMVGSRSDFLSLLLAVERSELRPVIDRVFDFEDAPAAFEYLERGLHFGKVGIIVS